MRNRWLSAYLVPALLAVLVGANGFFTVTATDDLNPAPTVGCTLLAVLGCP